jgi:hypothetical protein
MPRPYDHVIFTDLDGVEGVLVDLNTRQYFQLNETASLIWRGLLRGAAIDEIARELTQVYDVTLDHARASVEAAVARFSAHRLLNSTSPSDLLSGP